MEVIIACKKCGKPSQSKNKYYVLCPDCTKDYLKNLEKMAQEALKTNQSVKKRKREYHKIYHRIQKTRERLIDIPRKITTKLYDRQCLKCDKSFVATGKYNRICTSCNVVNNEIEEKFLE